MKKCKFCGAEGEVIKSNLGYFCQCSKNGHIHNIGIFEGAKELCKTEEEAIKEWDKFNQDDMAEKLTIRMFVEINEKSQDIYIMEEGSSGCVYKINFDASKENVAEQCADRIKGYIMDMMTP